MRCPSIIPDEQLRLSALAQYGLDGAHPLPTLEPIVRIAARLFETPVAAVNMIGGEEVFFAASIGIGESDMRRDVSFCAHAITQGHVFVVNDAQLDARFHDNPLVTKPGGIRFYAGAPVRHPEGHAVGVLCVIDTAPRSFSDDERKRLEEIAKLVTDKLELRRIEFAGQSGSGTFERIALTSPDGIISFNRHGKVQALNRSVEEQFGWRSHQIIGRPLELLLPTWRDGELARLLENPAGISSYVWEDLVAVRADGSTFPAEAYWSVWMEGSEPVFSVVVRDITVRRSKDEELYALANFDQASGLPNRVRFVEHLAEAIEQHQSVALITLGIRGFDDLIATHGQSASDAAFTTLADRIKACIRPTDVLARLGSGKMGLLMPSIGDPLRSAEMANTLISAIAQPFTVKAREVRFDANCGIVLSPAHGSNAEELIGGADLALWDAHNHSPGSSRLFNSTIRAIAVAKGLFEAEIHRALQNDEFELHYQPQVRLADNALSGAEALIRWNHPERGLLMPAAFLPTLEGSSLAAAIGTWVIDVACCQAAEWRHLLAPSFRMSVNLFGAQLRGGNLRAALSNARKRYGLPAGALELEITETTALADQGQLVSLFRELRDDGLELAFDDFGTGFASLSLLTSYPLSHLKIDKSFVQIVLHDHTARTIVRAVTDLAHSLGLKVIAEGVETERQLDVCREIGCDEVQGYLFGRPVSAAQFTTIWQQPPARRFALPSA